MKCPKCEKEILRWYVYGETFENGYYECDNCKGDRSKQAKREK